MLKHNDNVDSKEKVKYDLYKILRMSVLLSGDSLDSTTLKRFKDASLSIDNMLNEEYNKTLKTMFYNTETLEAEEKRLKDLIAFIVARSEKRKDLMEDYRNVTNKELTDLEYIDKLSELEFYEKRLDTIRSYLESSKLINVNETELEKLKEELAGEYRQKSVNESKNARLEETLYNSFINILYEMDLFSKVDLSDVDKEIAELQLEIREARDQKDTFITAFNNLKSSGINGELENEYSAFVENSKKNYYNVKEKEMMLNLYKLIEAKEHEYSDLYAKREEIRTLLQDRLILRSELGINSKDLLVSISDLISEQSSEIANEKENVDTINSLTERIRLKENKLEELRKEVKKPEILAILKEYSLIDTYDHDDVIEEDKEDSANLFEDLMDSAEDEDAIKDSYVEEVVSPNEVIKMETIPSMNLGLSRLKSISVMKRVADMLEINAKKEEDFPEMPEVSINKKPEVKEEPEDLYWVPSELNETLDSKENLNNEPQESYTQNYTPNVDNTYNYDVKEQENNNINENVNIINTPDNLNTNNYDYNYSMSNDNFSQNNSYQSVDNDQKDQFAWTENMETLDINGVFPN